MKLSAVPARATRFFVAATKPTKLAAAAFLAALATVPATTLSAATDYDEDKPYNPVEALREADSERRENAAAGYGKDDSSRFALPQKKRTDAFAVALAAEYFLDFGSDFDDADGWGGSLAAALHFNSDTSNWDFIGEIELLAFTAESGHFWHSGHRVTEEIDSVNLLVNLGLGRKITDRFSVEGLLGIGLGLTYDKIEGGGYDKSDSGNWTLTLSAKLRGEYRLDDNWSVFAGFRAAYISPSFASKIAGWHNLDLFSQSIQLGIRLRF